MKQATGMMMVFGLFVVLATPIWAADNLLWRFGKSCKTDIRTYCANVERGEGRILACLHGHSDELSEQCAAVVKEADEAVKRMRDGVEDLKAHCSADFEQYCKDVKPGKGRIAKCIKDNEADISQECKDALKEIESRK